MWFKTSFLIQFLLKAGIYLCLIVIIYFYQIIEVIEKYKENLTNIAISEEIMENGIKPPFMTMCLSPHAKQEILDKFGLKVSALSDQNANQVKALAKLNKTLEDFFIEATFKLNLDFRVYMIWWVYDDEGWYASKKQLFVGNQNFQKV